MDPDYPGIIPPVLPHDEIHYFLPGQVILQVEHPITLNKNGLAKRIDRFLQSRSQEFPWNQLIAPDPESILIFPRESGELTVSLVPTPLARSEENQDELVNILIHIYRQLVEGKPIIVSTDKSGTTTLKSVSPNWLVGSTYHGGATGGPGGWPKMGPKADRSWPKFQFPDISQPESSEEIRGDGIHVAILDTAPCLHDLIEAYERWHEDESQRGYHPLIESLLKPNGPLHVYPATYEDLHLVADYSAIGHRYRMPDHGLFVAGIVHTNAPSATLHLYEVLNSYGIGSLETVAKGILNVLSNPKIGRPLIVNCSLVLCVAKDGQPNSELPKKVKDPNPKFPDDLKDPKLLEHMRISFEEIIKFLDQPDVITVAAAGNDAYMEEGKPGKVHRPPARFPAAFKSVIGVGALPKEDHSKRPRPINPRKTASYSNLADDTPDQGYVTLGGEEDEQGMQGIFIHEFPKFKNPSRRPKDSDIKPEDIGYDPNDRGWAWWSGTSFAAPIISGLLAAWWSIDRSKTADDAKDFLDNASSPPRTEEDEKVILVEQVT